LPPGANRINENTLSYLDSNGNTLLFIYAAPVESSGNQIVDTGEKYISYGDYFTKTFPYKLSSNSPIIIQTTDNYIKVFPDDDNEYIGTLSIQTNVFGLQTQAIVYSDVFGKGINYICYPTAFGINTEIVTNGTFDTSNILKLKISMPECVPDITSPDYIAFKSQDKQAKVNALVYTPLVATSDGSFIYNNSATISEKDSLQNTYTIEYAVNSQNSNDVCVLNQSIHLYKAKQPDSPIYSDTKPECGHYLSPYLLLGNSTIKGDSLSLIRFEVLESLNIDPNQIISAKYIFRNLHDIRGGAKISAYAVTDTWCSINTRWNSLPRFDATPVATTYIEKAGEYSLDISALIIEMLKSQGTHPLYSFEKGFLISSNYANGNIFLASGDMGIYSPVLVLTIKND
jgi:hypothetical protein